MLYRGPVSEDPNTRGGCLTAWLIILLANISVYGILYQFLGDSSIWSPATIAPTWYALAILGISVFQLIFLFAIWMWKKWAVFAIIASAVIELVVVLVAGIPIVDAIRTLVPFAVLGALIRPKWHLFK